MGVTPLPSGVTVYSGWKICSKTQIDSLSNTVVLFIDCESAVRAMTRSPPRTGAPLGLAEVLEPDPPQPARTASALTVIRVIAAVVRCFTATPCNVRAVPGKRQRPEAGRFRTQGRTNLCLSQDDRKSAGCK